jgi:3-(3-hydroxy-phenyl)propionate hydroxylase
LPDLGPLRGLRPGLRAIAIAGPGEAGPGALADSAGFVRQRYGGVPGTTYLIRPDAHVAARFERFDIAALGQALRRAIGQSDLAEREAA